MHKQRMSEVFGGGDRGGMMGKKVTINGKIMWENSNGERLKEPDKKPNTYGWHKVEVEGKVMWENNDGERVLEP